MAKKKTGEGHLLKDDLSNYDSSKYKHPSVTVDIVICAIIDGVLQVLLIKRKYPPFRACWAIPGGFVDIDKEETLDEAAFRELKEETGLEGEGVYLEQLKTYGDPNRDPRTRVITVAYYALISSEFLPKVMDKIQAGDDAAETNWFPLGIKFDSPPRLAFDHRKILTDALVRLRGKIMYAPIALGLVPSNFTWTELQAVYEAILGRKLLASNFRRKLRSMYGIVPTGEKKNGFGRPKSLLKWTGIRKEL